MRPTPQPGTFAWTPKVCKTTAFSALFTAFGQLFYIHLGYRHARLKSELPAFKGRARLCESNAPEDKMVLFLC